MTMVFGSTLDQLRIAARHLRDAARELELIAVEDRPRQRELHLNDIVEHLVFELAAAAEQSVTALDEGPAAAGLVACHEAVTRFGATLDLELASPARVTELAGLRAFGREARSWGREVLRSVQACQRLVWCELHPALLVRWSDVTDSPREG